jgi:hypothetical protein
MVLNIISGTSHVRDRGRNVWYTRSGVNSKIQTGDEVLNTHTPLGFRKGSLAGARNPGLRRAVRMVMRIFQSLGGRRWFIIGGVGCLALLTLVVGAIGLVLVWGGISYSRIGAPTPDPAGRRVVLGPALAGDPGSSDRSAPTPVNLTIEMVEGSFEVQPGPPGGEIKVEGTFASRYYELVEERSGDEFGSELSLRLMPTAGLFTRVVAGLTDIDSTHPNHLVVSIPEDVPVALTLRLSTGESRTDLGGLTLTDLDVDLSLGEHSLDFTKPTRSGPQHAVIRLEMSDGKLMNLGNGRFRSLQVSGWMGNFRMDLGGAWEPGSRSEVGVTHSMSDLTLLIPQEVCVDPRSRATVSFGESNPAALIETGDRPEGTPVLEINLSTSVGGADIRRY